MVWGTGRGGVVTDKITLGRRSSKQSAPIEGRGFRKEKERGKHIAAVVTKTLSEGYGKGICCHIGRGAFSHNYVVG